VRVVPIDSDHPAPDALRAAAEAIGGGAVVAFPTDTLYGLAADPRSARAVERVYALKGRDFDRPLPLIAADQAQVLAHVGPLTELARRLAAGFWPGPLTLVVLAHPGICPRVHASTGRVAVRVPSHAVARELARTAGHPITATSANRSGRPPARTAAEVVTALGDRLALILDGGETVGGPPSTIVDVTGAAPTLVRAGVVPWARVLEFL
jgi:L-threonylcarbamoyladenylate synthase